jgi:hypothetical protein
MDTRTPEEKARDFVQAISDGATVVANPDTLRDAPQQFMAAGMTFEATQLLFAKTLPSPFAPPGLLMAIKIPTREEAMAKMEDAVMPWRHRPAGVV